MSPTLVDEDFAGVVLLFVFSSTTSTRELAYKFICNATYSILRFSCSRVNLMIN